MQMKFILKSMLSLSAALLVTFSLTAKEPYPKSRAKADNRVENMCQTVKIDNATKEKIKQITYDYIVLVDVKYKEKEWSSADERRNAVGKAFNEYMKQVRALIPSDQKEAFETWRKLPTAERDKKVTPANSSQNSDPQLLEKEKKARARADNRVENMCQTVKICDDLKQIAKDISYDYFHKVNIDFRNQKWGSEEERKAASSKAFRTYMERLKKMIPEDQKEAFYAWCKLSTAERDKKVEPAPSVPAPIIESVQARTEKRVANLCRAIKVNNKTKEQLEKINYDYFYDVNYLYRFRLWKSEDERRATSSARFKSYRKAMEEAIPADQIAAFQEWCKLPTAERDK